MTVVLDTNVLVAAFATRGLCQSVFELCLDRHTIAISDRLVQELTSSLRRKIKLPAPAVAAVEAYVRSAARLVAAIPLAEAVCRDPDDDHILALAATAGAEVIVSGDDDLLSLKRHHGVDIVSPRAFWDRQRDQ